MKESQRQYYKVGEVVIIDTPFPNAQYLQGKETIILKVYGPGENMNDIDEPSKDWNYKTDIPSPPPHECLREQKVYWLWCGWELRKKYEAGTDFESLINELRVLERYNDY